MMFTQCYSLSFEISARIAFSLILNQEDVNGQEEYESAWIYLMDSILLNPKEDKNVWFFCQVMVNASILCCFW